MHLARAECLFRLNRCADALALYQDAERMGGDGPPELQTCAAEALLGQGKCLVAVGHSIEALQCCHRAQSIIKEVLGEESHEYVEILLQVARCLWDLDEDDKALAAARSSESIARDIAGRVHNHSAQVLSAEGLVACYRSYFSDDHASALYSHKRILKAHDEMYGPRHPDCASSLINIGLTYMSMSKYHKALRWLREGKKVREEFFGADSW